MLFTKLDERTKFGQARITGYGGRNGKGHRKPQQNVYEPYSKSMVGLKQPQPLIFRDPSNIEPLVLGYQLV